MIYIAQIVELDRCLSNVQAWLRFDRHGAEVALMKENSNQVAPDQAVAAYIDGQRVGYVASADVPTVRALLGDNDGMMVRYENGDEDNHCFYVAIATDDSFVEPTYQERLSATDISGLSIPQINLPHFLITDGMEHTCQSIRNAIDHNQIWTDNDFGQLLTYAERLQTIYGTSLSGDHFRAVVTFLTTAEAMTDYAGESIPLLTDIYESLYNTFSSFAKTESQCLKIWKKELAQAAKTIDRANGFWSQLDLQLQSGQLSQDTLLSQTRQWLEQLPHNLFTLWKKQPSLFAIRLYYERFSTQELDLIKAHLITYTHAQEWQFAEDVKTDWGNILFTDTVQNYERANTVRAMHDFNANNAHKSYVDKLKERIQSYVARGIMRSPNEGNFTQYCRALKEYFGCEFDTENFRKAYKGKKSYR